MYGLTLSPWRDIRGRVLRAAGANQRLPVVALLGVVSLAGCDRSPTITDNSTVVVEPGRGVVKMCELGMTYSQIRAATHDATTHGIDDGRRLSSRWDNGRFVLIPSLGAIAFLGTNQPISDIEFHVEPSGQGAVPSLVVRQPFRGKLGAKLAFEGAPVTKRDVEVQFGIIERGIPNESGTFVEALKQGQPFWWRRGDGVEELWYVDKGIAFVLRSNRVSSFKIYYATGAKGQAR